MASRTERDRIRHARTAECIRWAKEQLMERYPDECGSKLKRMNGDSLRRNHPEEYRELVKSRRVYLNKTHPLEELEELEELKELKKSSIFQRLGELEERVRELENWRSQDEFEGLDEL